MDLLILGGGVFVGRACIRAALAAGHRVTVFNRGQAQSAWPAGVTAIVGDRKRDLAPLADGRWDAVIDTCGYFPADVRASVQALRPRCGKYLFVSSVSAYASFAHAPIRESDPLAELRPDMATDKVDNANYGALKAACEREAAAVFGADAIVVRPGLIVGREDRTGRFSYWPWRCALGGPVLAPGRADRPVQFIDAEDLGHWMVELLARDVRGVFNATGPVGGLTWGELLRTCQTAAGRQDDIHWLDEQWLLDQKVQPWSELPLWVPSVDPETTGFDAVDIGAAERAGMTTRPLAETIADILADGVPPESDPRRAGKLGAAREAELLSAWRNRAAASA